MFKHGYTVDGVIASAPPRDMYTYIYNIGPSSRPKRNLVKSLFYITLTYTKYGFGRRLGTMFPRRKTVQKLPKKRQILVKYQYHVT
jgi:hypothetical protein